MVGRRDFLHFGDDVAVVRRNDLSAVRPVGLVSVVLFRIVRSGDHYAAVAMEMTYREAQLRGRPQRVEQVNLEAVGRENVRHPFGEKAAVVAAVMADGHADRFVGESLFQVVRQSLSGHADRVDVHPVRADSHDSPQAARAELQIFIKTFGKLFRIVVYQLFNFFSCFFVITVGQPFFGSFFNN